jgi:hypothetical protein
MTNTVDLTERIRETENPSKIIYHHIIDKEVTFPEKLIGKWQRDLQMPDQQLDDRLLTRSFRMIYKSTQSTKIRNFQYRLTHRILGINSKLHDWGIKNSPLCDLCKKEQETYIHLFCECEKIQTLWQKIKQWTLQNTGHHLEISQINIILGTRKTAVLDLIIHTTKMYIYFCKMRENQAPKNEELIRRVEETRNIEKYIATKNNTIERYERKWKKQ